MSFRACLPCLPGGCRKTSGIGNSDRSVQLQPGDSRKRGVLVGHRGASICRKRKLWASVGSKELENLVLDPFQQRKRERRS